jgi:hypothetical protein
MGFLFALVSILDDLFSRVFSREADVKGRNGETVAGAGLPWEKLAVKLVALTPFEE